MIETLPIAGINSFVARARQVCRVTGNTACRTFFARQLHNFGIVPFVGYRVLVTMRNINPEDGCRVCSFIFVSKKRKRNIDGEFRKRFEEVFNQKLLTDDGLPHAVCDACHYRVQRMWKSKPSAVVIRVNELSKRRHPLSPLTSSQGDEQTSCHISKKKAYRIPFENVPIGPKPPSLEMSCPGGNKEVKILHEESTQTRKSSCHCFPVST